jgi:hypothetical protein
MPYRRYCRRARRTRVPEKILRMFNDSCLKSEGIMNLPVVYRTEVTSDYRASAYIDYASIHRRPLLGIDACHVQVLFVEHYVQSCKLLLKNRVEHAGFFPARSQLAG